MCLFAVLRWPAWTLAQERWIACADMVTVETDVRGVSAGGKTDTHPTQANKHLKITNNAAICCILFPIFQCSMQGTGLKQKLFKLKIGLFVLFKMCVWILWQPNGAWKQLQALQLQGQLEHL